MLVQFEVVGHDLEHDYGQDMIAFQLGVLLVGIPHHRLVRSILRDHFGNAGDLRLNVVLVFPVDILE